MADQQPPPSQHHSGLTRLFDNPTQLSADDKKCCDDLLMQVATVNKSNQRVDDEARERLWNRVFDTSWNTNCTIRVPVNIPERRKEHTSFEVGKFSLNLPPSKAIAKKRKADGILGTDYVPSAYRRAGATAYTRPVVNLDNVGVIFQTTDSKGSLANPKYIRLTEGLTHAQARADVALAYDEHERARVQAFNIELLVAWARGRLVDRLRGQEQISRGNIPLPQNGRPTINQPIVADVDDLVPLVTCMDKLVEMEQVISQCKTIAAARGPRNTIV